MYIYDISSLKVNILIERQAASIWRVHVSSG